MSIIGKSLIRRQGTPRQTNRVARPVRELRPMGGRPPRRDDRRRDDMRRNHNRPTPPPPHHHGEPPRHRSGRRKGSCFSSIAAFIIMLVLVFLVVYKDEVKEKLFPEDTVTTQDSTTTGSTAAFEFRNESLLEEHYEKHGKDMGYDSAKSYEKAASAVVTNPDSLHKKEAEDGDDVYYLEDSNEFVIVAKDGFIRTYFNPEDGLEYYNRQ